MWNLILDSGSAVFLVRKDMMSPQMNSVAQVSLPAVKLVTVAAAMIFYGRPYLKYSTDPELHCQSQVCSGEYTDYTSYSWDGFLETTWHSD